MQDDFSKQYWDKHYQGIEKKTDLLLPSPHLEGIVNELRSPGSALDAGCGEGADAIWLTQNGWQVTAVDISEKVLKKAKHNANKVGAQINFEQVDLSSWAPETEHFDLVTSHYVHTTDNRSFIQKLGEVVKVGGVLLVVGHQPSTDRDAKSHAHGSHITAEEISSYLNGGEWQVIVAESRRITKATSGGGYAELHDSVFIGRKTV